MLRLGITYSFRFNIGSSDCNQELVQFLGFDVRMIRKEKKRKEEVALL